MTRFGNVLCNCGSRQTRVVLRSSQLKRGRREEERRGWGGGDKGREEGEAR